MAALLSPSSQPGERDVLHLLTTRAALPQIRVVTLMGSHVNYEIKIQITIYFYKIIISYEKLKNQTYINTTKVVKIQIYSCLSNKNYGRINQYP